MRLHGVLAAVALLTLLMFGVFLWWFGPWHAPLGFGLWAVLNSPLLVIAYRFTRRRWLLYLGSGLFSWGVVVGLFGSPGSLWGEAAGMVVIALSCGVPLVVTTAWLSRAFPEATSPPPARWSVRIVSPLVISVFVMVAGFMWARAETFERRPNPAFASSFAGCYEMEFGRWIPGMPRHLIYGVVPPRLQLDTIRGHPAHRPTMYDTFERFQLLIRPGWSGSAYWKPIDEQRVDLHWNTGFGGVVLRMRRSGVELRGRAFMHSDADGFWPSPRALARARPIDCGLVPPDTLRARRDAHLPQLNKKGR